VTPPLICFRIGNTCRIGQRLRFWHRHLKNKVLHTPENRGEENHTCNAAMRTLKGLQSQGCATEKLCNADDRMSVESEDGAASRRGMESDLPMFRA
jgi:hypothetical protein